jgi:ribosomal subunit interface protein
MQLTVQGKQMDVGDALRTHVSDRLEDINRKFFNHATDATVTFSKEGHGHGVINSHVHIRVGKNIVVMADSEAGDAYGAFEKTAEKVTTQLRRYKNRLRNHHEKMQAAEQEIMHARDFVISETEEEQDETAEVKDAAPIIIAEMTTAIQTLSVSEAVMRMDLAHLSALLFRNASHGELNMVYRRPDGNVGWIDPSSGLKKQQKAPANTSQKAGGQKSKAKPAAKAKPKAKAPAKKAATKAKPKSAVKAQPKKAAAKKAAPKAKAKPKAKKRA